MCVWEHRRARHGENTMSTRIPLSYLCEQLNMTVAEAVDHAVAAEMRLHSYSDPTLEGVDGLSVDHAVEIATADVSLVFCTVPAKVVS